MVYTAYSGQNGWGGDSPQWANRSEGGGGVVSPPPNLVVEFAGVEEEDVVDHPWLDPAARARRCIRPGGAEARMGGGVSHAGAGQDQVVAEGRARG